MYAVLNYDAIGCSESPELSDAPSESTTSAASLGTVVASSGAAVLAGFPTFTMVGRITRSWKRYPR